MRRGATIITSNLASSSSDAGSSQSAVAAYVLARRGLLLGVSALPLLRAREAAAAAAVATPSSGDLASPLQEFVEFHSRFVFLPACGY